MSDEEWWDVRDADGVVTGERFRRGASGWPQGRYHLVVGVIPVRRDGRVLLARRAASKDWPLEWEFPAGSALQGETSEQAAIRELGEESGLAVTGDDLTLVRRIVEPTALFDVYTARVEDPDVLTPDPAEVAEAHWADLAEFDQRRAARDFAGPWHDRFDLLGDDLRAAIDKVTTGWPESRG